MPSGGDGRRRGPGGSRLRRSQPHEAVVAGLGGARIAKDQCAYSFGRRVTGKLDRAGTELPSLQVGRHFCGDDGIADIGIDPDEEGQVRVAVRRISRNVGAYSKSPSN